MSNKEKQRLVKELAKEMAESNLAIFAGAGLSVPAGFVNWSELLRPIADELDLDIEKETDLVAIAQYHCNLNQANRGKLNQLLINEFTQKSETTENHRILARLPISTYWTTNYDKLIENSLNEAGKLPDTKFRNKQLAYTKPKRDAVVYKMHGDVEHPSEAILTKDDYETYHVKMHPFLNALTGDLTSKTFLFLGFSFTDPNLDYILSRVRIAYDKDQRQHHCILKNVSIDTNESKADFEYRKRKQELFVMDLRRFGIVTVLIDNYNEITEILKSIEQRYKQKTVFISGAAHDYGKWSKDEAEKFVYELSKNIVAEDYRVVSGFGLGIGSSVITGVLEHVYMSGGRIDNEQLILRPFPQSSSGSKELRELWTEYRNDMLSYAGIAIFLFGNKHKDGEVILSDGMRQEFDIARAKKMFLIPVGMTGFMSQELWNEVNKTLEESSFQGIDKIKQQFEVLGDKSKSLNDAQKSIIEIIKLVNK
jgi:Sir2- and TIR-associating SLOG family/SIR2-like domain